jgi:hypothetical protein
MFYSQKQTFKYLSEHILLLVKSAMRKLSYQETPRQIALAFERELLIICAQVEQTEKIEAQKRRGYQV